MMSHRATYLFLALLLPLASLMAQVTETPETLSYEKYMELVMTHHPLAQGAELQIERGEQAVSMARGGFDPKLYGDLSQKYFKGDQYYSLIDAGLKLPTWMGMTFDAGFEQNDGVFLNPEGNTPEDGLLRAGVSVPVGRGLFIDERRAQLRKAQIAQRSLAAERVSMLNELLLEAGSAYWEWFEAYHSMRVFEQAMDLANERMMAVRSLAILGDKPMIDSLEAGLQYQMRLSDFIDAQLRANNTRALAEVHLWLEGTVPMAIDPNVDPQPLETTETLDGIGIEGMVLDSMILDHPELIQKRLDIAMKRVDLRMKREMLKPQVDLKYNLLTQNTGNTETPNFNTNDYDWGIELYMPVFLRKERAAVKLNRIKISESTFELQSKQQLMRAKTYNSLETLSASATQVGLLRLTAEGYEALLEGERELFREGESSLFLVNSRESSFVQANIKLISQITKNRKAELKARYTISNLIPAQ